MLTWFWELFSTRVARFHYRITDMPVIFHYRWWSAVNRPALLVYRRRHQRKLSGALVEQGYATRTARRSVSSSPGPSANWRRREVVGGVTGGLVIDGVDISCVNGLRPWDGVNISTAVINFSLYAAITSLQLEYNQIFLVSDLRQTVEKGLQYGLMLNHFLPVSSQIIRK